jgi:phosphoserine phosphatase
LSTFDQKDQKSLSPAQQVQITRWTIQQLQNLVTDAAPRIAVFDCDGTLWNGDSGHGFMVWSLEHGLVSRSTSDWMDTRYRAYLAGTVSEAQICGEMVQIYSGLREQELRDAAARYFSKHVQPHIFSEMAALVAGMQAANIELWAVSSTNKWVVSEGVRQFGIPQERVLAAEVKVANGMIASDLVDVPTGPAKAAALHRVGISQPDAVFGNSLHDLAMLEIAAHPFPVNPSPALLEECAKRGWGYFLPREVAQSPAPIAGE